jgi:hypothetical protein
MKPQRSPVTLFVNHKKPYNWYLCNDKCIAKAAKGAAKRTARESSGKKSKKDKKVRTLENAVFSGECVCACVADV